MIAFGPVPSRRLGRSLGINNIPPKVCTYSCVYCQVGRTRDMRVERSMFYRAEDILAAVDSKVNEAGRRKEAIDILTFVPDGEPTLDVNLGAEIELLRSLGIRIGVVSNASLIWSEDVRSDLSKADWVSLKIDSVDEHIWRRINRPHGSLKLDDILEGIQVFSREFEGELATETMLVRNSNDDDASLTRVAGFISTLDNPKSYISVPTRPPAVAGVEAATEDRIAAAYQLFGERSIQVECLVQYEGDVFAYTGDVRENILSIASVHPMRKSAVAELLLKADADWSVVDELIEGGELKRVDYKGAEFFVRRFARPGKG